MTIEFEKYPGIKTFVDEKISMFQKRGYDVSHDNITDYLDITYNPLTKEYSVKYSEHWITEHSGSVLLDSYMFEMDNLIKDIQKNLDSAIQLQLYRKNLHKVEIKIKEIEQGIISNQYLYNYFSFHQELSNEAVKGYETVQKQNEIVINQYKNLKEQLKYFVNEMEKQEKERKQEEMIKSKKYDKQNYGNFDIWDYSYENEIKDLPAITLLRGLSKLKLEALILEVDDRLDKVNQHLFSLPEPENEDYFIQKYWLDCVDTSDYELQKKEMKRNWQELRKQLPLAEGLLNQYRQKIQEKLEMAKKTEKNGNNKNGLPDYCTMFETLVLACFNIPLLRNQVKSIEKYFKDLEDSGEYVPVYAEQDFREGYFNYIQNELDEILMKDTFNGIMDYDSILNPLNDDQVKSIIHRFEDIYNKQKVKDSELYLSYFSNIRHNGTDIIRALESAIINQRNYYKENSVEKIVEGYNKREANKAEQANIEKLENNYDRICEFYRFQIQERSNEDKLTFLKKELKRIKQTVAGKPQSEIIQINVYDFDGVLKEDYKGRYEYLWVKIKSVTEFLELEIKDIEDDLEKIKYNEQGMTPGQQNEVIVSDLPKIHITGNKADIARIFEFAIKSGLISDKTEIEQVINVFFSFNRNNYDSTKNKLNQFAPMESRSNEFYNFTLECAKNMISAHRTELLKELDKLTNGK